MMMVGVVVRVLVTKHADFRGYFAKKKKKRGSISSLPYIPSTWIAWVLCTSIFTVGNESIWTIDLILRQQKRGLIIFRKSTFVYIFLFWPRQLKCFRVKMFLKNCTASFCVFAVVNSGQTFQYFYQPAVCLCHWTMNEKTGMITNCLKRVINHGCYAENLICMYVCTQIWLPLINSNENWNIFNIQFVTI